MLVPSRHGTDSSYDQGVGRPRDPQIDAAVLRATVAALGESGYARLTLNDVARRAGTTKPAIYRRWEGRQRLVLAALGLLGGTLMGWRSTQPSALVRARPLSGSS